MEETAVFTNPKAGVTLVGTLTIPKGAGRHPAIILVSGAGDNTRDGYPGYGPGVARKFLVMADHLTRRGWVVLRFDKRGLGESTGDSRRATVDDFADDVICGMDYLRKRKEVDPGQIGLIGHSEGAQVAPLVASREDDVAWVVMMAGVGLNGEAVLLDQYGRYERGRGRGEEDVQTDLKLFRGGLNRIMQGKADEVETRRKVFGMCEKNPEVLGFLKYLDAHYNLFTPWGRRFVSLEPSEYLRKVRCPVLVLGAEKDVSVPPSEHIPAVERALKRGGNAEVTSRVFPNLNHGFRTCRSGPG